MSDPCPGLPPSPTGQTPYTAAVESLLTPQDGACTDGDRGQ